uniref:Uncharacterized protein n=1 Tax=Romanomermis culicivorax TaxID=13658 RepID=A0A915K368_ROMCU
MDCTAAGHTHCKPKTGHMKVKAPITIKSQWKPLGLTRQRSFFNNLSIITNVLAILTKQNIFLELATINTAKGTAKSPIPLLTYRTDARTLGFTYGTSVALTCDEKFKI